MVRRARERTGISTKVYEGTRHDRDSERGTSKNQRVRYAQYYQGEPRRGVGETGEGTAGDPPGS